MFVIGIDTDISTKTIVEFLSWAKRRRLKCVCGLRRRRRRRGKCVSRLLLRRRTVDNTKKGEEEERERATCPHLAYNTTSTKKARKIEKISKKTDTPSLLNNLGRFDFWLFARIQGGKKKRRGRFFFLAKKNIRERVDRPNSGRGKKAEKKK